MSARPPHDTPPRHLLEQELRELRIHLEGTWEVLEQARDRQTMLLRRLSSRQWLRRLQRQPESLRQVREHQATLDAALERAEHWLQKESAPGHHPLRLLLLQLRDQRVRLEAIARERLAYLGEHRALSLVEALAHLEVESSKPRPGPLDENETVLLSGRLDLSRFKRCAPVLVVFLSTALFGSLFWAIAVFALCPVLFWLLFPNVHRFWLTPRRLVWLQFPGGRKNMPLESIRSEGITHSDPSSPWDGTLRVRGLRTVRFRAFENLDLLAGLLKLYCGPPLYGRVSGPPSYPVAMFPATRRSERFGEDYRALPGLIVLRPGHVAFLPQESAEEIRCALFGTRPSWYPELPVSTWVIRRFSVPFHAPEKGFHDVQRYLFKAGRIRHPEERTLMWMMQRLRLLPAEDFDRYLHEAVRVRDGELWPAATVTHGPAPSGAGYQFTSHEPVVLTGFPEGPQREAMDDVLRHWPR